MNAIQLAIAGKAERTPIYTVSPWRQAAALAAPDRLSRSPIQILQDDRECSSRSASLRLGAGAPQMAHAYTPKYDQNGEHSLYMGSPGEKSSLRGVVVPTSLGQATSVGKKVRTEAKLSEDDANQPIGIIGGGVSGIFAALTLQELGYTNVTILERESIVGGKAASFKHKGRFFPLGAVSTPFALRESSFTGAQIFEKPLQFVANVLLYSATKLQVLDANNLVVNLRPGSRPRRFSKHELSHGAISAWHNAFGAKGAPERFYPHAIDFARGKGTSLARKPRSQLLPSWGRIDTSWPLIYVSSHGYGVAQAAETPPYYYWTRFAQKSTNAARNAALGPRGPALRGFDTSGHLSRKLAAARVAVRSGTHVQRVTRSDAQVEVETSRGNFQFSRLILATDLKAAVSFMDVDSQERDLFSAVRHIEYYTVASHINLPMLKPGSVYYLGDHQGAAAARDAGQATRGCPTILFRAARESNLTISWAYGGLGVGAPQIEACLRSTIRTLGGEFGGIQKLKAWTDYFPYVSAEQLRGNYHKQLDQLQGRKRTYLVGEIFNLPLVSECVDWSRYLIKKFFKDQRDMPSHGTKTRMQQTTAPAPATFARKGSSPAPAATANARRGAASAGSSFGKAQRGAAPVASR